MMNLAQLQTRMKELKEWSLEGEMIVKDINFNDFKQAMEFVNKVAEIAESMNHHPDIVISYNIVRLSLTTHSEHGLTENDFDVAQEIDRI